MSEIKEKVKELNDRVSALEKVVFDSAEKPVELTKEETPEISAPQEDGRPVEESDPQADA